jgi:hypothetical protein
MEDPKCFACNEDLQPDANYCTECGREVDCCYCKTKHNDQDKEADTCHQCGAPFPIIDKFPIIDEYPEAEQNINKKISGEKKRIPFKYPRVGDLRIREFYQQDPAVFRLKNGDYVQVENDTVRMVQEYCCGSFFRDQYVLGENEELTQTHRTSFESVINELFGGW